MSTLKPPLLKRPLAAWQAAGSGRGCMAFCDRQDARTGVRGGGWAGHCFWCDTLKLYGKRMGDGAAISQGMLRWTWRWSLRLCSVLWARGVVGMTGTRRVRTALERRVW